MLTKNLFFDFGRQGFSLVPLYKEIKLKNIRSIDVYSEFDEEDNNYILEFFDDKDTEKISYSVIGIGDISVLEVYDEKILITKNGSHTEEFLCNDPLVKINNYVTQYRVPFISEIPLFAGGLVGYMLEGEIHCFSNKESCINERPNSKYLRSDELIVYDSEKDSYYVIVQAEPNWEENYYFAINRIDEIIGRLISLDKKYKESGSVNETELNINLDPHYSFDAEFNDDKSLHKNDYVYELRSEKNEAIKYYDSRSDAPMSNHKYMLKFSGEYIVGTSSEVMAFSDRLNVIKKYAVVSGDSNNQQQIFHGLRSNVSERLSDIQGVYFLEKIIKKFRVNSYFKFDSLSHNYNGESVSDYSILKNTSKPKVDDFNKLKNKNDGIEVRDELCGHCVGYFDWHGNINLAFADNAVLFKKSKSAKCCEN